MVKDAQEVLELLRGIPDPELPFLNIVDLGIVRSVALNQGVLEVELTPTFSGCSAMDLIEAEVHRVLGPLGPLTVKRVLAPAWSSRDLSPEARQALQRSGIAPPLLTFEAAPIPCPRCGSLNTELKNAFGSTRCKALAYCRECQEPFEVFKDT
jgi:ring-1,2-phenylacetyl-CoA epoxidase subunit PaaD